MPREAWSIVDLGFLVGTGRWHPPLLLIFPSSEYHLPLLRGIIPLRQLAAPPSAVLRVHSGSLPSNDLFLSFHRRWKMLQNFEMVVLCGLLHVFYALCHSHYNYTLLFGLQLLHFEYPTSPAHKMGFLVSWLTTLAARATSLALLSYLA